MTFEILPTRDARTLAKLNKEVQVLHHRLYPEAFKPFNEAAIEAALSKLLKEEYVTAFVARTGHLSVGYVLCMIRHCDENAFQFAKESLEVDQLVVSEAYRKQGVGKRLMERAKSYALDSGINILEISHWEENYAAEAFFTACGFKPQKQQMVLGLSGLTDNEGE